jgi:glyoxylase-like metal-dependent hydrolase (beta-lactamase superfamily II)
MKTTTVTDNLIQMTRYRFVNAFLVREDDGFTLVDTTLGGGADEIIAAAQQAGAAIRRIALTHGHGDHAGSLDALKNRLGDVEILIGDLDARIHRGEKVTDAKLTGSWPKDLKTRPDVALTGGERVGSLEVVPSPGHTPGHMAFLDTRDRTLIAGDVFTTYGATATTTRFYWRFPFATMGTYDKPTDLESARKLRQLDPSILVVGHGPAVRSAGAAMDAAIEKAQGARS